MNMIRGLKLVFTYEAGGIVYVSPEEVVKQTVPVKQPNELSSDEKFQLVRARVGQYPRKWKFYSNTTQRIIIKERLTQKMDQDQCDQDVTSIVQEQIHECQGIWNYIKDSDDISFSCGAMGMQSLKTIIKRKMHPIDPADLDQAVILVEEYVNVRTGYCFSYPGMDPVQKETVLEYITGERNNCGIGAAIIADVLKNIYQTDNMQKVQQVYDALFRPLQEE
jgi:hypothetical protein